MSKLNDRLTKALDKDSTIVTPRSKLGEARGKTEDHLLWLGLTKGDLLRLERAKLAIRAYSKNEWMPGETMPSGKVVDKDQRFVGPGRRKVWILIGEDSTDA